MQIIQSIREKGAAITIVVIAIALIGFILLDAKSGSSKLFGGAASNSIGKVNGKSIELKEFNRRVNDEMEKQAGQTGKQPSGVEALRLREQVWNTIVAENVFYKESDKLGITLTSKELTAIFMSSDPENPLMKERGITDSTGKIDQAKAADAVNQIKKMKPEDRARVDAQVIEPLRLSTAVSKYGGLLNASAYYPKWMQAKDDADGKNFATITYAAVAYAEVSDSAVKVTDEDINAYVAKRKSLFKQEAGRRISYLDFSELPTAADSGIAKQQVEDLKADFVKDTNAKVFTVRSASSIPFTDEFKPLSKITSSVKDTLVKQPIGTVYGPYADGPDYVIAKLIATKTLPDSVKSRHILIGTIDPQTQQPTRSDSSAKILADSILTAIKGGADFASLVFKYSDDQGSKLKGGEYTADYGYMVPEYNEFTFTKPVGEKAVVKTQFGYHVIEVLSQKGSKPLYKIAYVGKKVVQSDETITAAGLAATKASNNKTTKDLVAYAQKNGLKMTDLSGLTIKENDFSIGNMPDARSLVQWIFKADKGDVSEPINVGDRVVVATVTKIYKEGVQDAETARPNAEAAVRNMKKADIIIAKIGANPTVESAAAAYNRQPLMAGADSTITMSSRIINGLGAEPKVIGAAFNKEYQSKPSPAFAGATGVYVIKVNGIAQKAASSPEETKAQTTARFAAIRQASMNWFEALRTQADISDKRGGRF